VGKKINGKYALVTVFSASNRVRLVVRSATLTECPTWQVWISWPCSDVAETPPLRGTLDIPVALSWPVGTTVFPFRRVP
jgi:hypothetical protein